VRASPPVVKRIRPAARHGATATAARRPWRTSRSA
jgi:hypothetical protein